MRSLTGPVKLGVNRDDVPDAEGAIQGFSAPRIKLIQFGRGSKGTEASPASAEELPFVGAEVLAVASRFAFKFRFA